MDTTSTWPFVASSTATALITKYTTSTVSFDVTADVVNFLNGTPNDGWIMKKTDEGNSSGTISFASANTSSGPMLVISYQN
jgi:hypothetical protein